MSDHAEKELRPRSSAQKTRSECGLDPRDVLAIFYSAEPGAAGVENLEFLHVIGAKIVPKSLVPERYVGESTRMAPQPGQLAIKSWHALSECPTILQQAIQQLFSSSQPGKEIFLLSVSHLPPETKFFLDMDLSDIMQENSVASDDKLLSHFYSVSNEDQWLSEIPNFYEPGNGDWCVDTSCDFRYAIELGLQAPKPLNVYRALKVGL